MTTERITTLVISDSHVASTIIGGVPCSVHGEVSVSVDRYVVAIAQLIGVAKTINIRVPRAVHFDVSFTINVDIPGPVNRDIPIAIHRNITSRAKFLFPL